MLLGVLLWSFVHLLANGDLRGTILFGAFFAYGVVEPRCPRSPAAP
jgi:uncharacterized membrane protein